MIFLLWMLTTLIGNAAHASVTIFDVTPVEQNTVQRFEALEMYEETSTFVFNGKFKSIEGNTTLFIGLTLDDGSFNDDNNRAYEIAIQRHQIGVWAYTPRKEGGKRTNFRKSGQNYDYNFKEGDDFELTMDVKKSGGLRFSLKSGETRFTLTKPNGFFSSSFSVWEDAKLMLELQTNNALVFTSIVATTGGSSDGSDDQTTITCPTGQRNDSPTSCVPCPDNYYGTDGINCKACPGQSTSPSGSDELTDCVCNENFYRVYTKAVNCEACPSNGFSDRGATSVAQCKCPADHYKIKKGKCSSCPPNSSSEVGSNNAGDCRCQENYYKDGANCLKCPKGTKSLLGSSRVKDCKKVREKLIGEITPLSAENSHTYGANEEKFAAKYAFDLIFETWAKPVANFDGESWIELKLDEVHCIRRIERFHKDGSTYLTWTCSPSGCICEGYYFCNKCILTVFTVDTAAAVSAGCKHGNRVKLRQRSDQQFMVSEIAIIEKQGKTQ
ncbi:uncharacterized protein LOC134815536 [Bolinopsis microptera]|uniref:uncharacterized protein LOC134815536 n=1 Tax=Bolinopsis microptera TaxID=2820187 RepID=UPI00307A8A53